MIDILSLILEDENNFSKNIVNVMMTLYLNLPIYDPEIFSIANQVIWKLNENKKLIPFGFENG